MKDGIPIPTDNIYKFYALFGLLLLIFSIGALLHVTDSTNRVIFDNVVEIESIKQDLVPTRAQEARRLALEKMIELKISDRSSSKYLLSLVMFGAIVLLFYGFAKWHKVIQPRIDQLTGIELEMARLRLRQLQDQEETTKE